MINNVAAAVILYNPENNVIINMASYTNQVNKIYVIDNSDEQNIFIVERIKSMKNVEYIWNQQNLGIAEALNIGAKLAVNEKFDYLLTMDQDSEASPTMVSELMECFDFFEKVALVGPILFHPEGRKVYDDSIRQYEQVLSVWTSGSIVSLQVFKLSGGFMKELFIDYVDHEFCLRLNKMGYKVYLNHKSKLKHELGKINQVNLFFRKVYPTNHSPIRLYYRTRNRFYVKKKYEETFPEFFNDDNKDFWRSLIKVILFEKQKLNKLIMIIKGFIDYKKNNFGKYSPGI